ncbi:MAG TPA: fibrobacter succinogenes major paralogous domain-containing protein [Bacteroidia bacterium]|nr:fibrobacter succinogenes major paralogous domain-containing protein [Bacteroidia bacterium]
MAKFLTPLLTAVIILMCIKARSQTIMNVYQSNGIILQLPLNTIDSITYTIGSLNNIPIVVTQPATNITATTIIANYTISNYGGSSISQSGICWSTSPYPTTSDNTAIGIIGNPLIITGLTANTTYYLRGYAINNTGVGYGNEIIVTTALPLVVNSGVGVNYNGHNYQSVVYANGQEWMTENLRTAFYANGDSIPNVSSEAQWTTLSTGAWVNVFNNVQYDNPYGKLYNWYAVSDVRNLCPTNWHVADTSDWSSLINYLGGEFVAGGKMKSTDTLYWPGGNLYGNNESGLAMLPAGYLSHLWLFDGFGFFGNYWCAEQEAVNTGYMLGLVPDFWQANIIGGIQKKSGLSVRCVKN